MMNKFLYLNWRVVLFGTNTNNSGKSGVFALNVNNTWSNDNVNIGSHLCLLNLKKKLLNIKTLPLGKKKRKVSFSLVD